MRNAASWISVLLLSGALHIAAAFAMVGLLAVREVPQKPSADAKVKLTTLSVPRTETSPTNPESEGLTSSETAGQNVQDGVVPMTTAKSVQPSSNPTLPISHAPDLAVLQSTKGVLMSESAASASEVDTKVAPFELSLLAAPALPQSEIETKTPTISVQSSGVAATALAPQGMKVNEAQARAKTVESRRPPSQTTTSSIVSPASLPTLSTASHQATAVSFDAPSFAAPRNDPNSIPVDEVAAVASRTRLESTMPDIRLDQVTTVGLPTLPASPASQNASPISSTGLVVTPSLPSATRPGTFATDGQPANSVEADSEDAVAVLAWSGDLSLQIGQQTLDAAAALGVASTAAQENGLRDALSDRLNTVECARAQTVYDPTTGAIDLRGHVRTDADRDTLMAAVSAELQGALPIVDRLRRLDAPQCEVLVRLAEMPLPQSVEQLTNPLIIGDDLHTRVYRFQNEESVRFDLTGADYDGWLYLDYFDNEGQVLHLIPNEFIEPFVLPAEQPIVFGGGSEDDLALEKFELRVSPPFGQDIAIAMVSNRKLFETNRATVELAEGYLDDLSNRVTALRETDPDFKGEWVYLFVETFLQN